MTPKQLRLSLIAVALLAMLAVMSACGKKGDPIRPGEEPDQEEPL